MALTSSAAYPVIIFIGSVLSKEKRAVGLAQWHYTVNVHLLMLQGRVVFGTPHTQVTTINFTAAMESYLIAKVQSMCNG
jgi:hypothetical protein